MEGMEGSGSAVSVLRNAPKEQKGNEAFCVFVCGTAYPPSPFEKK